MKTNDVTLKNEVLAMLQESGSLDYTRRHLKQLQFEIMVEAGGLGPNPDLEKLMRSVKTNIPDKLAMA